MSRHQNLGFGGAHDARRPAQQLERVQSRGSFASRSRPRRKVGLTDGQLEEVQGAWEMFEDDGSGTVDLRELKIAMRSLGFDVGKRDVSRLVSQVCGGVRDVVTYDEFVDVIGAKMPSRDGTDEIAKIFGLMTVEGNSLGIGNCITTDSLRKVAGMVGLDLSQADISDMVFEADREGQGQVYEDDFRRVMRERGSLPVDESDSD